MNQFFFVSQETNDYYCNYLIHFDAHNKLPFRHCNAVCINWEKKCSNNSRTAKRIMVVNNVICENIFKLNSLFFLFLHSRWFSFLKLFSDFCFHSEGKNVHTFAKCFVVPRFHENYPKRLEIQWMKWRGKPIKLVWKGKISRKWNPIQNLYNE